MRLVQNIVCITQSGLQSCKERNPDLGTVHRRCTSSVEFVAADSLANSLG